MGFSYDKYTSDFFLRARDMADKNGGENMATENWIAKLVEDSKRLAEIEKKIGGNAEAFIADVSAFVRVCDANGKAVNQNYHDFVRELADRVRKANDAMQEVEDACTAIGKADGETAVEFLRACSPARGCTINIFNLGAGVN